MLGSSLDFKHFKKKMVCKSNQFQTLIVFGNNDITKFLKVNATYISVQFSFTRLGASRYVLFFDSHSLAFCMTLPFVEAYVEGGRLRSSAAQFTGSDSM